MKKKKLEATVYKDASEPYVRIDINGDMSTGWGVSSKNNTELFYRELLKLQQMGYTIIFKEVNKNE